MAAEPDGTVSDGAEAGARSFRTGDQDWLVHTSGRGVAGSDAWAGLAIQVLQFAHAEAPDRPLVETVAPCRDLSEFFDDELVALLEAGITVGDPEGGARGPGGP